LRSRKNPVREEFEIYLGRGLFIFCEGEKAMILFIILSLWLLIEILFYLTHKNPLNDLQIEKLSIKRRKRYIRKNYTFHIRSTIIDSKFKSKMNSNGKLYSVNLPLPNFPAYVSALLKGKKHEWVVLAIEGEGVVKYIWTNKGFDSSSVNFFCDISDIINLCKDNNCYTIMRFHNHPNSSPNTQTCFLASEQDKKSAHLLSATANSDSLNWLDFVCERGNYLKYFEKYSDTFIPKCALPESIKNENAISKYHNYKLHRELGIIFK